MQLFVDEAQYWLWGQELAFGYYSKPPLIAWAIRAATGLGGSDTAFWVRLPAPLLHLATALLLGATAARLWHSARAALFVALAWGTLPMVALGSAVISTDTVMFPFLALALYAWVRAGERPGPLWPLLAGVALGLAFLAKYAALYYLIGAVLAAALVPAARRRPEQAALALLAFAVVIAPNLLWNLDNGFSTLEHTMDNADWVRDPEARVHLDPLGLLGFLGAQFGVFGPVLAGALAVLAFLTLREGRPAPVPMLLCLALPPLLAVSVQALISNAYANWAASAYVAGTVAVMPWLLRRARIWAALSLGLNGALCLALPLASIFADRLSLGGTLPFERYLGRAELSQAILAEAGAEGLQTVTARNRDILADLFYTGRDSGLDFRATPEPGRPRHHYALKYPLDPRAGGEVLYVTPGRDTPPCTPGAAPLAQIAPESGAWAGKTIRLYRVPAACWG